VSIPTPDPSHGFLHITGKNKDRLAIVFSALQIGRIPTYDFYSTFANNQLDTDVIFVRDTENLWYQLGTAGAHGGFDQIITYLRKHIQTYKRVVTFGASMGGYAALAVMPYIPRIKTCLAIAPQAFIDQANRTIYNDTRWENNDMGRRMIIINRLLKRTPFWDLKQPYEEVYDGRRPVHIIYGGKAKDNKIHGEYLGHIAGVQTYEIKEADHFIGQKLKDRGILTDIVRQIIQKDTLDLSPYNLAS